MAVPNPPAFPPLQLLLIQTPFQIPLFLPAVQKTAFLQAWGRPRNQFQKLAPPLPQCDTSLLLREIATENKFQSAI